VCVGFTSCEDDDDWRVETAAIGIGDALDVVGDIPWRQTML